LNIFQNVTDKHFLLCSTVSGQLLRIPSLFPSGRLNSFNNASFTSTGQAIVKASRAEHKLARFSALLQAANNNTLCMMTMFGANLHDQDLCSSMYDNPIFACARFYLFSLDFFLHREVAMQFEGIDDPRYCNLQKEEGGFVQVKTAAGCLGGLYQPHADKLGIGPAKPVSFFSCHSFCRGSFQKVFYLV